MKRFTICTIRQLRTAQPKKHFVYKEKRLDETALKNGEDREVPSLT